jgi:hypothetical protein
MEADFLIQLTFWTDTTKLQLEIIRKRIQQEKLVENLTVPRCVL